MTQPTPEYGITPWLQREVTENMTVASAPTYETRLKAGRAEMAIRRRGAAITKLALVDGSGALVDVLYADPDHRRPKLPATHAMMPVSDNDGLGGRHGVPRWLDYYSTKSESGSYKATSSLDAIIGDSPLHIQRNSILLPRKAQTTIHVVNNGPETLQTSLGEHIYFALPEGATAHDVRINGDSIDALTGQPGITESIAAGHPHLWRGYRGTAEFQPSEDVTPIELKAHVSSSSFEAGADAVDLLLWQRPSQNGEHQPSICIEPVVGYSETSNRQLAISPHYGYAALSTTFTAL